MDSSEILILLFTPLLVLLPLLVVGFVVYWAVKRESRAAREELAGALRQQTELLAARFDRLEERTAAPPAPASAPAPVAVAAPREEKISEDKLMIIGGVLACYFGKRVKVRSARVIFAGGGSNVWSQQGRAAVQASHRMSR